MTWKGKGHTDIGKVRQLNQDAFGIYDHLGLWLIADGMGGHAGGEVASQLAIQEMAAYFEEHKSNFEKTRPVSRETPDLLQETLEAANRAIRVHAHHHIDLLGMGTTAVAVHITEDSPFLATIAHAGDSRAYLVRDQTLRLLTKDHSLVEERIEQGILTPEQALTHPLRHVITRALGIDQFASPSETKIEITEADQLLLCTDGLTKMMTDQQILDTLLSGHLTAEATNQALIKEANKRGGEDNVTVVLIRAEG